MSSVRYAPSQAAARALFDAVVETSDDAVVTVGADGTLTSWSGPASRLFGRPAQQVLGTALELLWPEDLRGEARALAARAACGDRLRHVHTEVLRGDGMPVPVSVSSCPLGAHAPGPAVLVIRDSTEQQAAQAALAELHQRLQGGEERTHVGTWWWDVRTNAVQWSAELHRIHGVDPLDFDGTIEAFLSCVSAADRDRVRAALAAAVGTGELVEQVYRVAPGGDAAIRVRLFGEPALGSGRRIVGLRGTGTVLSRVPPGG